jgi:Asp-tRNA(Asn)/Glu-tRNA(Gln) amidotransferase A subunit family amidase
VSEATSELAGDLFLRCSVAHLIDQLQYRIITPRALADECIERTEQLGDRYKVWVTFDKDILIEHAEGIQKRLDSGGKVRALEGIPVGVKDIFNTIDLPTQMGSPLWRGFTPGNDARIVHSLRDCGAAIPGKTDTAEFAVHAIGNCLNPHDVTRTPGTSSSGSAVAVALGIVPVAVGTQTAGSITRPASFCGVYGCKPSFGLIPRTGMLKTTDSLDTVGFFCAMREDMERMFDILRVHGPNYPLSHGALSDESRQNKPDDRPWRVAFVRTHTWEFAAEYSRDALLDFVARLQSSSDIVVEDVALPAAMDKAHEVHQTIYDKTLSYYFRDEFERPDQISPIMKEIIERGQRISVADYHAALRAQFELTRVMDEFTSAYDVLVSLSTSGEAPLRDEVEKPDPSLMWTLTHLPVVSAPVFTSPAGLPFGAQFAARKYNDLLLLRFTTYLAQLGLIPSGVNPIPPI